MELACSHGGPARVPFEVLRLPPAIREALRWEETSSRPSTLGRGGADVCSTGRGDNNNNNNNSGEMATERQTKTYKVINL